WPLFPYWLGMLTDGLGYQYQHRIICAADADHHGPAVAQTRTRWFGIFTRPRITLPHWPEGDRLAAGDFLDPDPGPTLTGKPRAASTMERIEATLRAHPDESRWLLSYYGASKVGKPVSEPCGTL